MQKSIAECSLESKLLYAHLLKLAVGDVASYQDLSAVISRDIRKHRGALYTAMRMAQRENKMIFDTVIKVGIKRMDDAGIGMIGEKAVVSIRRKSSRSLRKLACANIEALTNGARIRHNTTASVLGVLALVTKPSNVKRLKTSVTKKQSEMPTAETMKLFSE